MPLFRQIQPFNQTGTMAARLAAYSCDAISDIKAFAAGRISKHAVIDGLSIIYIVPAVS